jgi:ubiquinone/menaquinone biosynthesis C-methylase UbiE
MLKMYLNQTHAGDSSELWEENWRNTQFNQALHYCTIDPVRPLFEKYSKPKTVMLEGGCGMGQYVAFYTARGWTVVGLDFAQNTLNRLHTKIPHLTICAGDVSAMPFADESFDLYYSGGVVEHFESGAEKSLQEAFRVLKNDGVLLLSVPYLSPLRRMLAPFNKKYWRKVSSSKVEEKHGDLNFFQYAYTVSEFQQMLNKAGFEVVETQGYSVLWGLYELPFLGGYGGEIKEAEISEPLEEKLFMPGLEKPKSSILKRLVVSEDSTVPILGLGVKLMRWACSNMMMYVCVKK